MIALEIRRIEINASSSARTVSFAKTKVMTHLLTDETFHVAQRKSLEIQMCSITKRRGCRAKTLKPLVRFLCHAKATITYSYEEHPGEPTSIHRMIKPRTTLVAAKTEEKTWPYG